MYLESIRFSLYWNSPKTLKANFGWCPFCLPNPFSSIDKKGATKTCSITFLHLSWQVSLLGHQIAREAGRWSKHHALRSSPDRALNKLGYTMRTPAQESLQRSITPDQRWERVFQHPVHILLESIFATQLWIRNEHLYQLNSTCQLHAKGQEATK